MSFLVALVALVDSTPMIVDDNYNSPGTIGFIVTFVVAAIAVLLFCIDLTLSFSSLFFLSTRGNWVKNRSVLSKSPLHP